MKTPLPLPLKMLCFLKTAPTGINLQRCISMAGNTDTCTYTLLKRATSHCIFKLKEYLLPILANCQFSRQRHIAFYRNNLVYEASIKTLSSIICLPRCQEKIKVMTRFTYFATRFVKVDCEDHFWRPGFLHIIICVFWMLPMFKKRQNLKGLF